ncbi:uncharacterized protein V6R79_026121 [Siganus canaliculatus]
MEEHRGHDTVTAAAERTERQRELEGSRTNIQQRIQDRQKELKLLQQEVEDISRSADKTVEDSQKIFTQLISVMEQRRRDVEQQVRSQQEVELQFHAARRVFGGIFSSPVVIQRFHVKKAPSDERTLNTGDKEPRHQWHFGEYEGFLPTPNEKQQQSDGSDEGATRKKRATAGKMVRSILKQTEALFSSVFTPQPNHQQLFVQGQTEERCDVQIYTRGQWGQDTNGQSMASKHCAYEDPPSASLHECF